MLFGGSLTAIWRANDTANRYTVWRDLRAELRADIHSLSDRTTLGSAEDDLLGIRTNLSQGDSPRDRNATGQSIRSDILPKRVAHN